LTIFGQDSEDLYVYDTNPSNPLEYRYRSTWEKMKVLRETILVKEEAPATVDLRYTRHGPVLFEDAKNNKACALRAAWLETGCAPYLARLRMNQVRSWEEFREACSFSRIPAGLCRAAPWTAWRPLVYAIVSAKWYIPKPRISGRL
jgi:penicillin amidase